MVKPSAQTPTDTSSPTFISTSKSYDHPLPEKTLGFCPKHPLLAPAKEISTENPTGTSIFHGISAFQVHRIHLPTFLQYFPAPWVHPICSGISRYTDNAASVPNAPNLERFRNPFSA